MVGPRMERAFSGETVSYESELPYHTGGSRWIHAVYTLDRDEGGRVRGVVVLVKEITARKRAEDEQAASRTRLSLAPAAVRMMAWESDVQGSYTVGSAESERLRGFREGTSEDFARQIHPENMPAIAVRRHAAPAVRRGGLLRHGPPDGFARLPGEGTSRTVTIPNGASSYEAPSIELAAAVPVRGKVLDAAGATVVGLCEGGVCRPFAGSETVTDPRGEFRLPPGLNNTVAIGKPARLLVRLREYDDPTVRTAADGSYELEFILPGEHFIRVPPSWLDAGQAPEGTSRVLTLAQDEARDGVDFQIAGPSKAP